MALIIEDSQKVTQRKIPVPKNAQKIFSALYNALEPNMGKNNLKNLKNLATDKTYNNALKNIYHSDVIAFSAIAKQYCRIFNIFVIRGERNNA